jgi:uncharacterized repeat protein (TIGR03803 family)
MRISRCAGLMAVLTLGSALVAIHPSPVSAQPVQVLHRFTPSPRHPYGPLVRGPAADLYGVTESGAIFRLSPGGQVTAVAHVSDRTVVGGLALGPDGWLYGVSREPDGIFRVDPTSGEMRDVHRFTAQTDGLRPLGQLVAVGGSLYGVTQTAPGSQTQGAIFHVVAATGAFVIDAGTPAIASTPLELAADGRLYGMTYDTIYRFDPATGTVTTVQTVPDGGSSGLTLGPDGSLYGTTQAGAGTVFRFTPATGVFEQLYTLAQADGDGIRPGPLVAGADGHLYGVTELVSITPPFSLTVFRVRLGAGGAVSYETLQAVPHETAGSPERVELTRGADGLIYGYATLGGPNGTGTLFRFDPSAAGPAGNPTAFTVVHAFPRGANPSRPSPPVAAADGFLYGLTNAGGAANRGVVYRVEPATGAVTLLGEVPGAPTQAVINSALVAGPDGFLYATSQTGNAPDFEYSIIRVAPATGVATVAVGAIPASIAPSDLVRTSTGEMYGGQRQTTAPVIVRFDPVANTVTPVASLATSPSRLTVTGDGQVIAVTQQGFFGPWSLVRLDSSAPTGAESIPLGPGSLYFIDRLVETADGQLYLGATYQAPGIARTLAVVGVNRTTGALRLACAIPARELSNTGEGFPFAAPKIHSISLGPDGAIYGSEDKTGRLFRCDPRTGAVTQTGLPRPFGGFAGPMTGVGGMLYGASFTGLFRIALDGILPALDSDADGLPNTWETAFGLDPFSANLGSGPADDPDGDGRDNYQELGDGTHPRGFFTRLFAEGATGAFFRTLFDITALDHASIRARFFTEDGAVVARDLFLPGSHLSIDPATLPGLGATSFSTAIESDVPIVMDRTMTWDASGYGSHLETALEAPSTTWFFAEGSTSGDFLLFYLLQNPQPTAVTATVTYLRPFGHPPIVRTYTLPARSRTTIGVDGQAAELASTDVSAAISATAPIVAERAMYLNRPGQALGAGHGSAGVTAPASHWFLAEGATGSFFDLFVLIANPNPTPAVVEVEYLRSAGPPLTKTYTVPAQSRFTIWVDDEQLPGGSGQKPLAAVDVSTVVRSTNGVPVVVERTMWWPGPQTTADFWYEAHNSPGATGTAFRWAIAGAELGGSDGGDTYLLIANPMSADTWVRLTLVTDDADSSISRIVQIGAKSRVTVWLRSMFNVLGGRYGVLVESQTQAGGSPTVPIVVERATYASPGGVVWGRGGNALATPLP